VKAPLYLSIDVTHALQEAVGAGGGVTLVGGRPVKAPLRAAIRIGAAMYGNTLVVPTV